MNQGIWAVVESNFAIVSGMPTTYLDTIPSFNLSNPILVELC